MAQSDAEQAELASAAAQVAGPPAPVDGVPGGELRIGESMPIISIEPGETGPIAIDAPPVRAEGSNFSTLPGMAAGSSPDEISELELDALALPDSELELGAIARRTAPHAAVAAPAGVEDTSGKVSVVTQATVAAAGFLDTDFGELAVDIEKAVLNLQSPVPAVVELDASVRYASIEDAISSISPDDADPTAIDFDDGSVVPPRRSRPIDIPTPAEIAAAAVQAEPPALGDIAAEATMTGDFSVTAPITVLFRLTTTRANGLLSAAVGGIKKEIYVRGGIAEYVTSNMASELLGNYLVSRGALSAGELAMALAMMPHYGGKLGDTLVGLGLLKPLEVFRHLTYQVRQKLIDVCTWNKGIFAWYEGAENQRTAFPLDLNSFEVLGAGAMALRDDTINAWMMERAASTVVRSRPRPSIELERFEISGLPSLYQRVDGVRTVGQIITASMDPTAQRRTARMLLLLEQCEIIRTSSLGI